MVDRVAARIVVIYSVDKGWQLEHIYVKSEFLHEDYLYEKPVYIREAARSDGTYKHGKPVGILILTYMGTRQGHITT